MILRQHEGSQKMDCSERSSSHVRFLSILKSHSTCRSSGNIKDVDPYSVLALQAEPFMMGNSNGVSFLKEPGDSYLVRVPETAPPFVNVCWRSTEDLSKTPNVKYRVRMRYEVVKGKPPDSLIVARWPNRSPETSIRVSESFHIRPKETEEREGESRTTYESSYPLIGTELFWSSSLTAGMEVRVWRPELSIIK